MIENTGGHLANCRAVSVLPLPSTHGSSTVLQTWPRWPPGAGCKNLSLVGHCQTKASSCRWLLRCIQGVHASRRLVGWRPVPEQVGGPGAAGGLFRNKAGRRPVPVHKQPVQGKFCFPHWLHAMFKMAFKQVFSYFLCWLTMRSPLHPMQVPWRHC